MIVPCCPAGTPDLTPTGLTDIEDLKAGDLVKSRPEGDDGTAACSYANFCRVTGTPEELIVDFGLNSQPTSTATEPIQITERLVTNYYTAKRMLQALHLSVQRHEQAFGTLETDIQKRVVPRATA